jgi:hypothetical protein
MKTIAPIALILLLSSCIPADVITPTSTPTITPTETDILFYDDFSDPQSGWWVGEDEESKAFFSDGEYHILLYQGDMGKCYYTEKSFMDGVIEIELRQISGDADSWVAIAFRDDRENNGYIFAITNSGYYDLLKYENNTPTILFHINNQSKGIGYTLVTVSMHNNEFDLFVNKTFVGSAKDSAFSSGYAGFCVFPDSSVDTEYAFDNFVIYQYDPLNPRTPKKPEVTPTPAYKAITWMELADFLVKDHTNFNQYDPNNYMCMDFAIDLVENARKENIKAWIVLVDFTHGDAGHAFVAFETSDKGIRYVEPQMDYTYSNLAVGSLLCDDWGKAECMGVVEKIGHYWECDHDYYCIEYVP